MSINSQLGPQRHPQTLDLQLDPVRPLGRTRRPRHRHRPPNHRRRGLVVVVVVVAAPAGP